MKAGILIGHLKHKGNEGGLIRTAEAFGFNSIFVIGKKEKTYNTAQGSDRHCIYYEFKDYDEFIEYCYKNNHSIICIENVNYAQSLESIKKYPINPVFIIGNEKFGVPNELLKDAKLVIKIPQANSYTNCLNTTISGAIVMYNFYEKIMNKKKELWNNEKQNSNNDRQ